MRVSLKKIEANRKNAKKSTGPRTARGKAASRFNALRHGVLAQQVVIPAAEGEESPAEFDALLARLCKDLNPQGALEEMLVEKVAVCYWRLGRVLRCEAGEIKKGLEAARCEEGPQGPAGHQAAKRLAILPDFRQEVRTPWRWLSRLTGVLEEVRNEAQRAGLLSQEGGTRPDGQSAEGGDPPGSEGGNRPAPWLNRINREIAWVRSLQLFAGNAEKVQMEAQGATFLLPSQEVFEKLRRYEGMLERQLYRAMRQLERLQRLRKGEAVPAPLSVEVAHE